MKKVLFVILTCCLSICCFAVDSKTNIYLYSVNKETIPYTAVLESIPVDHVSYRIPSEVTINDTIYVVTGVESHSFTKCKSLRSVTIPSTITHIDSEVFASCKFLDTIVVEEGNKVFDWQHACNAIINSQTGTLVIGTKNTIIPDGVTKIGPKAFYNCTSLTSIKMPNSVKEIGDAAFNGCSSLTSITIGEGVTNIGWMAFKGCSSLTSVTIPNGVKEIGNAAFNGCKSLTSVTIPNSVTSIGARAFNECSSLTSVTIPNSVVKIDSAAFKKCTSLASIIIPDGVTTIKSDIFAGCTMLDTIVLPSGITHIESGAFYNTRFYQDEKNWYNGVLYIDNYLIKAQNLLYCVVREGTTLVADNAFGYSFDLWWEDIQYDLLYELGWYVSRNDLKRLSDEHQEYWCMDYDEDSPQITRVVLPNSVRYIGRGAFANCMSLISVELGDSLISIGEEAFTNCAFATIALPSTLQNIGVACFAGCSLNSITIPGSVAKISEGVFYACERLKKVTIMDGVQNIENFAFYSPSLKSITLPKTISSIGSKAFGDQIKIAFQK